MPIKPFGGAAEGRGAAELEATRPTLIEVVTTEPAKKRGKGHEHEHEERTLSAATTFFWYGRASAQYLQKEI